MRFNTKISRLASATIVTLGLVFVAPALADIFDTDTPLPTSPISRHLVEINPIDSSVKRHVKWLAGRPQRKEAKRLAEATALPGSRTYSPTGSIWDRLATCESGGRWNYNGGSGYDGGLQHHPGTWSAYRRPGDPAYAHQASREQQIAVAERVRSAQGWGAWPACSRRLGLR